ncbi:MAG: hypothetical protein JOZ10_01900 [Acidobacteria bacterium]|nr:hypothetical protein [Acidobacteriota bacterium]MBV9145460.1 hypothetical protein [Acidobacteriota bacterium]MBV9434526.1 hypothetical protein [Acidobacteriota bacterium]
MSASPTLSLRRSRTWLIWLCLVAFMGACVAESAHYHRNATSVDIHCSLCLAAHSIARPAAAVNPVSLPTRCVSLLTPNRLPTPDSNSILSSHIRPPPAA